MKINLNTIFICFFHYFIKAIYLSTESSCDKLQYIFLLFSVYSFGLYKSLLLLSIVQASDDDVILHLDEANKLAKELSDRKKELKAAMCDNKLASFSVFPSMGHASQVLAS